MFCVAEKCIDEGAFYRSMNHITSDNDAVANDVKYHLRSWTAAKHRVAIIDKSYASQEIHAKPNVTARINNINILKTELSNPSNKVIVTNQVASKHQHLLVKHGMLENDLHISTRNN